MADRDLTKEFDTLKKDFQDLQKDLKKVVETGGRAAGEEVEAARNKLQQEAEVLMKKMQDAASGAVESGERVLHNVEGKIEDRPFASVLTVLGVGFAVGWLVGRK